MPASLYEEFGTDPELWSLIQELLLSEILLTDSTEQSRERPQDQAIQKDWYSGKKKQHTQKTQILGTSDGLEIVDAIAGVKLPTADINLFQEQQPRLHPEQPFMGDKAYIGAEGWGEGGSPGSIWYKTSDLNVLTADRHQSK